VTLGDTKQASGRKSFDSEGRRGFSEHVVKKEEFKENWRLRTRLGRSLSLSIKKPRPSWSPQEGQYRKERNRMKGRRKKFGDSTRDRLKRG